MAGNPDKLSKGQWRFVNAYRGNAHQAAVDAGYSEVSAKDIGAKLLRKPKILEALKVRNVQEWSIHCADRFERRAMLSVIMRDPKESANTKIAACIALARIDGDLNTGPSVTINTNSLPADLSIEELQALAKASPGKTDEGDSQ